MVEVQVDSTNFEQEVLKSDIPVLADFYADWCAPCVMLAPAVEEIAKEYQGRLKVCKVNVDNAQDIAMSFGIMSIPTIIVFNQGRAVEKRIGLMSKSDLESMFVKYLNN